MKPNSLETIHWNKAVLLFLIENQLPFQAISSKSFLAQQLNPRYVCPSSDYFAHSLLPLMAIDLANKVCIMF
jgi:hypothetical protein